MLKKILKIVGIILVALILVWLGSFISGDKSSVSNSYQSLSKTDRSGGSYLSPMEQTSIGAPGELAPAVSKGVAPDQNSSFVVATNRSASRLVIKSGGLNMVVENVNETAKSITKYVEEKNGYVVSGVVGEEELVPYGQIIFRVPAEKFDEAMEYARDLATKVKYENTKGQDITEQYTDLQSRLRNLEAAEKELLNLMQRSGKLDDVLAVQQQLTNVREQIELLKGQMQYLDQSVRMALITVNLALSEDLLPIPPAEKWQPIYVLKQAWHSLLNALRGISHLIIWLVVYAVIWVPLAAIVWLVWKFFKRR